AAVGRRRRPRAGNPPGAYRFRLGSDLFAGRPLGPFGEQGPDAAAVATAVTGVHGTPIALTFLEFSVPATAARVTSSGGRSCPATPPAYRARSHPRPRR